MNPTKLELKRCVLPFEERSETDTFRPRLSALASSLSSAIFGCPSIGNARHCLPAISAEYYLVQRVSHHPPAAIFNEEAKNGGFLGLSQI